MTTRTDTTASSGDTTKVLHLHLDLVLAALGVALVAAVVIYRDYWPHQPAPPVPDTWTITATATCPDGTRHDLALPAHLADNSDLVIDGDIPNPCTP